MHDCHVISVDDTSVNCFLSIRLGQALTLWLELESYMHPVPPVIQLPFYVLRTLLTISFSLDDNQLPSIHLYLLYCQ